MSTRSDRPVACSHDSASFAGDAPDDAVRGVSINAKLLPPTSPVVVPNFPPKLPVKTAAGMNEAAANPLPRADEQTESNWADGAQAQPWARNARSSLL